jgi:polyribonucleotide nucleotidyltransferase
MSSRLTLTLFIISSRAVDRALRPLLQHDDTTPRHYHVHTSVQAMDKNQSGHPVALAINTASAALGTILKEPVAAVVLALMPNGTIVVDPTPQQVQDSYGELL